MHCAIQSVRGLKGEVNALQSCAKNCYQTSRRYPISPEESDLVSNVTHISSEFESPRQEGKLQNYGFSISSEWYSVGKTVSPSFHRCQYVTIFSLSRAYAVRQIRSFICPSTRLSSSLIYLQGNSDVLRQKAFSL